MSQEGRSPKVKRPRQKELAMACLAKGGYLTICGNLARYVAPGEAPGVIAHHRAVKMVQTMNLEHFACGRTWPYPDQFRINHSEKDKE